MAQEASGSRARLDPGLRTVLARLSGGDGDRSVITVGRGVVPQHRRIDQYVAVPDATRPRFLVPTGARSAMASTLTSYIALRPARTRALRWGLAAAALAGGLGRVVGDLLGIWVPTDWDDGTVRSRVFAAHVRAELGEPGAMTAMGVHHLDAHYKPTAQLFTSSGRPLGFAKLGWTPATGALVRREREALASLTTNGPRMRHVSAPDLLLTGSWDGLPYLVTAPLPADVRGVSDADPLARAAEEVAGPLVESRFDDSPYSASVSERISRLAPSKHPLVASLRRATDVLRDRAGGMFWRFGRWHGDWVSWNVARAGASVHAWDWEHSAASAPWGFDLLHWQVTVPHLRHGIAYETCVARARSASLPGVPVPVGLLLLAYLIEMGLRSLELAGGTASDHVELYPGLADRLEEAAAAIGPGGGDHGVG